MKLWDIVEYSNLGTDMLYKHECEDFNTHTKLIVREGQVAVFIKNGALCDIFQPGRYSLKTENIPVIKKLVNLPTNGESSFKAELYFIASNVSLNVLWGTPCPMQLQDPVYKIIVSVGASGETMFKIVNPLLFLRELSATKRSFSTDNLIEYFGSMINTYIKNAISDSIFVNQIPILGINSSLVKISNECESFINKLIIKYGVQLENFTLENIHIPNDDPSIIRLKNILAKKAEMDLLGYSYQDERTFDVMGDVARNDNTGVMGSPLMGLGLGIGFANNVSQQANNMVNKLNNNANNVQNQMQGNRCPNCGANLDNNAMFCSTCGYKVQNTKLFCSNCGKELEPNSKFCKYCGVKQ